MNQTDILSPVIGVEQLLSPPVSQLIPDSIINDKQTTERIFNEENSTHFTHLSKFITFTPVIIQLKGFSNERNNRLLFFLLLEEVFTKKTFNIE
jgi:hypothetical protein